MSEAIAAPNKGFGTLIMPAFSRVGRTEIAIACLSFAIVISTTLIVAGLGVETYTILSGLVNIRFLYTVMFVVLGAELTWLLIRHRPDSPTSFLLNEEPARKMFRRVVPAAMIMASIGFFMPAFSRIKSSIPLLTDYTWDATFIAWDQAIHGTDPWRLLQPLLGYPEVTAALGHLYHWWFGLIYVGPLCFALYVSDKQLRLRFFLGYFLTWSMVGMIGAISFASVGPVFLEPLIGDSHFAEQMAYLNAANAVQTIPVIEVQQLLLEWYESGDYGLGRGITAMPSMHIALTTLYLFATWKIDKRLGVAFGVFWLLIMLGSVHLAYHYAVDGYVSFVLVGLIWVVTKPVANFILTAGKSPRADAAA